VRGEATFCPPSRWIALCQALPSLDVPQLGKAVVSHGLLPLEEGSSKRYERSSELDGPVVASVYC
jgi:hypothetical protein